MTDSSISGNEGTKMKGSIIPCSIYPIIIIQISLGKSKIWEGPVQRFTKKLVKQAVIKIARFSNPVGRN